MTEPPGMIEVDARGLRCPRPVIELAKAVEHAASGSKIRIVADDPSSEIDIPIWCRMKRHRLLDLSRDDEHLTFIIEVC